MAQDERHSNNNMQSNYEPPPPHNEEKILLHWRKLVPNSLTALAIVAGMSALFVALEGEFRWAVFLTFLAAVLDGADGPAARYLNGASRFGAELDSLADYANFGVTPAFVIYLWKKDILSIYWWGFVCILYAVAMACRLARFNAGIDFNASQETMIFFMGVPAPAAAMLVTFPLCLEFASFINGGLFSNITLLGAYYIFVSWLVISEIPTFSSKAVKHKFFKDNPTILYGCVIIPGLAFFVGLWYHFWLFMVLGNVIYLCLIPISAWAFQVLQNRPKTR